MVIEPPRDAWRRRIFEIDNGVLVTNEFGFIEQRPGAMHQADILEFGVLANSLPVKSREECRRTGSVKTLVVVKDPYLHRPFPTPSASGAPDCASQI